MSNKTLIIVAAMVAMALGIWVASSIRPPDNGPTPHAADFHGSMLSTPRNITVPALLKDDGSVFTVSDLQNHWTLMFFGYTHCPDVCPTAMNTLAQAKKKSPVGFPEVIFVSVDPERDTVDIVGEYIQYFDPSFKAVTGDEKLIEALTLQMSAVYMRMPGTSSDDENYIVDHSSAIMALNPEGKLIAYINPPHTPESILQALVSIKSK